MAVRSLTIWCGGFGRRSVGIFTRFAQIVRKPNWLAAQASQPLEETNKISSGRAEYRASPSRYTSGAGLKIPTSSTDNNASSLTITQDGAQDQMQVQIKGAAEAENRYAESVRDILKLRGQIKVVEKRQLAK